MAISTGTGEDEFVFFLRKWSERSIKQVRHGSPQTWNNKTDIVISVRFQSSFIHRLSKNTNLPLANQPGSSR